MTAAAMAELLVAHLDELETLATSQPAPFIAVLSPVALQLVFQSRKSINQGPSAFVRVDGATDSSHPSGLSIMSLLP